MKKKYDSITLTSLPNHYRITATRKDDDFDQEIHLYDLFLVQGHYIFINPITREPVKAFVTSKAAGEYLDGLSDKRIVE